MIFIGVGALAGGITHSSRYIVGGISALLAAIVTGVLGRLMYHIDSPLLLPASPAEYFVGLAVLLGVFLHGVIGAAVFQLLATYGGADRDG